MKELKILYFALKRLTRYLEDIEGEYQKNKIYYDIGSAYHSIAGIKYKTRIRDLKKTNGNSIINERNILMEVNEYSKAIEYFDKVNLDRTDIFFRAKTDYSNILDTFGRYYESIMLYNRILKLDSNFGMALGNKAKAIIYYYKILPDKFKFKQLLVVARDLFEKSLRDERLEAVGGEDAVRSFQNSLNKLDKLFSEIKTKETNQFFKSVRKCFQDLLHRLISLFSKIRFRRVNKYLVNLRKYQRFVLDKNLFLNFHFGFNINKNSQKDIMLPPFISKKTKGDTLNYHGFERNIFYAVKHLNQIIEDFTSARYLYFLANIGDFDDIISNITEYIYTLDYTHNNLEYGILKTIFTKLFNILDKIANFLYMYFDIEHSRTVNLNSLTYEKFKKLVKDLNNPQLLALFEVAVDFQVGHSYNYLQVLRNNLVHKYLDIKEIDGYEIEDEEYKTNYIYKDKFFEYIQLMFEISKAAILYTVLALETERDKMETQNGAKLGPIIVPKQSDIFKIEE
ncbi:MAG: hypothetical protein JW924_02925 [Fusobacteriaceae bacterium]|nr:hypothetical protein [Fusobacteriaceae bacterium]